MLSLLAPLLFLTFTNPIRDHGPDPWIVYDHGFFYLMTTTQHADHLAIWKARSLADLHDAPEAPVLPHPEHMCDLWAPELHRIDGAWYIYFAADSNCNADFPLRNPTHRIWVISNSAADPTTGQWTAPREVTIPSDDHWAIDATVFENRGQSYIVWSGWPQNANGEQDLYIARLKNPWTIEGDRVRISHPTERWEKQGMNRGMPAVNEGPEVLKHGAKIFLVFSASHCSTDDYVLGMLTASADSDLLNASSWTKSAQPVFHGDPAAHAFGLGHNGFFQSPDGKQDWIIYHANPESGEGCGNDRSTRAQSFHWNPDGTPNFGAPVALGTPLAEPSGEPNHPVR